MKKIVPYLERRLLRNYYSLKHTKSKLFTVNMEAYPLNNVGDTLGPVISRWMLSKKGIDPDKWTWGTKHLLSVGSVLTFDPFDATVWGSGVLSQSESTKLSKHRTKLHRKLDVRAVRGPLTREALISAGYNCPEVYGDPAILLPYMYSPNNHEKKYEISLVLHYRTKVVQDQIGSSIPYTLNIANYIGKVHIIDPQTTDYKAFVNEIVKSKRVISSSLHGIIISEAYNIPCVFLNWCMSDQIFKYYDWYYSTKRDIYMVNTLDEALEKNGAELPDLTALRQNLISSFPYDLWE